MCVCARACVCVYVCVKMKTDGGRTEQAGSGGWPVNGTHSSIYKIRWRGEKKREGSQAVGARLFRRKLSVGGNLTLREQREDGSALGAHCCLTRATRFICSFTT